MPWCTWAVLLPCSSSGKASVPEDEQDEDKETLRDPMLKVEASRCARVVQCGRG